MLNKLTKLLNQKKKHTTQMNFPNRTWSEVWVKWEGREEYCGEWPQVLTSWFYSNF